MSIATPLFNKKFIPSYCKLIISTYNYLHDIDSINNRTPTIDTLRAYGYFTDNDYIIFSSDDVLNKIIDKEKSNLVQFTKSAIIQNLKNSIQRIDANLKKKGYDSLEIQPILNIHDEDEVNRTYSRLKSSLLLNIPDSNMMILKDNIFTLATSALEILDYFTEDSSTFGRAVKVAKIFLTAAMSLDSLGIFNNIPFSEIETLDNHNSEQFFENFYTDNSRKLYSVLRRVGNYNPLTLWCVTNKIQLSMLAKCINTKDKSYTSVSDEVLLNSVILMHEI